MKSFSVRKFRTNSLLIGAFYFCLVIFRVRIEMRACRSCCARLCERLMCCKKKEVIESRRTSMNSKKQSIAPTLPPEDTRPKIDESLVDHTSLMKAAIPVLPVSLAWFCLICNCLIPGFGMYTHRLCIHIHAIHFPPQHANTMHIIILCT